MHRHIEQARHTFLDLTMADAVARAWTLADRIGATTHARLTEVCAHVIKRTPGSYFLSPDLLRMRAFDDRDEMDRDYQWFLDRTDA